MECVWATDAMLGEGPTWDARDGTLWFVDIKRPRVFHYNPGTGERHVTAVGGSPSFIFPADDGAFLLGNGHCLQRFDGERIGKTLAQIDMPVGNRLNDATVDCDKRLWFGTMDDDELAPSGQIFRWQQGLIARMGGACPITNGPAISCDGRQMYYVDTLAGLIWRYEISVDGALREGNIFVRVEAADGTPDGITMDVEDHLWVGLWNGWAARRYAPNGSLVATVRFPCANITKLAFGGSDGCTAFATTARVGLSDTDLKAQPLAGGLFAFRVDVPGGPLPLVHLPS